ncbi:nanos homolog 2-like [Arctopsyche grandis]
MYCGYCHKNGESYVMYNSHYLRSPTGKLSCPILRSYICPTCGATGDDAHTIGYCPLRSVSPNGPRMF